MTRRADHTPRSYAGLSALEIVIVVTILGTLAGFVVGPRVYYDRRDAYVRATKMVLDQYNDALHDWHARRPAVACPRTLDEVHLSRRPVDAWGRPLVYRCPGTSSAEAYDLLSAGPDGRAGTTDDVVGWE